MATSFFFSPQMGPVGTKVLLISDDGIGATSVKFNGISAPFNNLLDGTIEATVPPGATTGRISITFFGGSATSSSNFTVTTIVQNPVPVITSFSPGTGSTGTVVQVFGSNLGNTFNATLNNQFAFVRFVTASRVDIDVPQGATTGRIRLQSELGIAVSPTDFVVPSTVSNLRVDGFNPGSGKAGDPITITGAGFNTVQQVFFSGIPAAFSILSASQISAQVPSGASTGKVTVRDGQNNTATSLVDFVVQTQIGFPAISGFNPGSGKAGDTVVITGQNLGAVNQVSFNGVPATFVLQGNLQLTTQVPVGASTGPVRVRNSAGEAVSGSNFNVTVPVQAPQVLSFSPASGKVGDTITITGSLFSGATQVRFGGIAASFSVQDGSVIRAVVPSGAATGPIAVTNPAGTGQSQASFMVDAVVPPPGASMIQTPVLSLDDDIVPLVDNENGPDFEPGGNQMGTVSVVAGQTATLTLFANRFDGRPDTVNVMVTISPQNPALSVSAPTQVQANSSSGFKVRFITNAVLMPGNYNIEISGKSATDGSPYSAYKVKLVVAAAVEVRVANPSLPIFPGQAASTNIRVIRRRFGTVVTFGILGLPSTVSQQVTFVRTELNPAIDGGGAIDIYSVRFLSQDDTGLGDILLQIQVFAQNVFVQLPNLFKLIVQALNTPQISVTDQDRFVTVDQVTPTTIPIRVLPLNLRGNVSVRIVLDQDIAPPEASKLVFTLPAARNVTSDDAYDDVIKVRLISAVTTRVINYRVELLDSSGAVRDFDLVQIQVVAMQVEISFAPSSLTIFPNEMRRVELGFDRNGYNDAFRVEVKNPDTEVTVVEGSNLIIPAKELFFKINLRGSSSLKVGSADIIFTPFLPDNSNTTLGPERKLMVLKRVTRGLIKFLESSLTVAQGATQPTFASLVLQLPIGTLEELGVIFLVTKRDEPTSVVSGFMITTVQNTLRNSSPAVVAGLSSMPMFNDFGSYTLVAEARFTRNNRSIVLRAQVDFEYVPTPKAIDRRLLTAPLTQVQVQPEQNGFVEAIVVD